MNMTNVLLGYIAGLTTVKATQQGRLTVARKNPAFWATPGKPGLTGTAAALTIHAPREKVIVRWTQTAREHSDVDTTTVGPTIQQG